MLTLAIVGPGRAGKDTAAEWLRDHTYLTFQGGSSWTGCKHVAEKLGLSFEEAWRTRHERRMDWYTILNEYRKDDPSRLIRDCLAHSQIVCGVRDRKELQAARKERLLDLIIWIGRAVPVDPTLTFTAEDADLTIFNTGTLADFHGRLYRLAKALQILRDPT